MKERTTPPERARKQRRALSHVGGQLELEGDDALEREIVTRALDVHARERETLAHVHGFHSYPARLHPVTAARLIEGFSKPRDTVLDPFCGSGTTLVEGRLLGRTMFGTDLNPLGVALARLKTRTTTAAERERLREAGEQVVNHAEERRERRAGPTHRYGQIDRDMFEVHVLLELDGLRSGITALEDRDAASALLLVLSAILTKVSRKPGDTAERLEQRRLASGYTIRLFSRKLSELLDKLAEFAALLPKVAPKTHIFECDARSLEPIRSGAMKLIVCSPPYPGIYDYSEHHVHRLRWLGMATSSFREHEIGARRTLTGQDFASALRRWQGELGRSLAAMHRVLAPGARAAIVMADAVLAGRAVYADSLLRELGPKVGMSVTCRGSQRRPHFHPATQKAFRERPRREHLIVLRADVTHERRV